MLYVVDQGAGLIDGSAGDATNSYERSMMARSTALRPPGPAWACAAVRSPAADDLALYFEELLEGTPSISGQASFYAPVFADAGNVLREWKFRVQGPKHSGAPDAEEFLQFVAGQLPELAKSMRRDLALRSAACWSSLTQRLRAEDAPTSEGAMPVSTDGTSDTAPPSQHPLHLRFP